MSDKPPAKRRRVELTLADRVSLIRMSEMVPKPTQKDLSEKFGVGESTVGDILRKKDIFLSEFEKNGDSKKKRFGNSCKFEDLNDLVWQWFCQALSKNIPISGLMRKHKYISISSYK